MAKFYVVITETLKRVVEVEAADEYEAEDIVDTRWCTGDIVLDADDFDSCEWVVFDESYPVYGEARR